MSRSKSLQADLEREYPMPKGTIKRLIADRGFGFIQTEQGTDLFFHRSEIQDVEFGSLIEGQEVEFDMGRGRDDRPRAVRVRLVQPKDE